MSSFILPLDTETLQRLLSSEHGTHFLGVFAMDQLPTHLPSHQSEDGYCMIVNTDPSNLAGQHWLAVYINAKTKLGEVFDSFGRIPPLTLQRWLVKHCRHWTYSSRFVQGPITLLCGAYCIFILHKKCTTQLPMNELVDIEFVSMVLNNDDKMIKFLSTY